MGASIRHAARHDAFQSRVNPPAILNCNVLLFVILGMGLVPWLKVFRGICRWLERICVCLSACLSVCVLQSA